MNAKTQNIKLSIGPVLYYWPREQLLEFYERMAETPVDIIYLGETVCSKRKSLRTEEWLELAQHLKQKGKQVVLSTLSLIEAESELKTLRRLCQQEEFTVEANDMAAIQLLSGKNSFVTGPTINVYNQHTLNHLQPLGLQRWVMPVELSRRTLEQLQQSKPEKMETEVFCYGRMPLSIAARCFTARAYNLPKDDCQFRCLDDPDGITLRTQEDQPFLTLNGVQTQSAQTYNLLDQLPELRELHVDVLRISPQSIHTEKIIQCFYDALYENHAVEELGERLNKWMPTGPCDGYWHNDAGIKYHMSNYNAGINS